MATPGRHEHSRYFLTSALPPLLRQRAEAAPPAVLADLGAGEGAILYALDRAGLVGERIYAVDLSSQSLAVATELSTKAVAIVSDVTQIEEIASASVDAVTSSQVIEHLPDDRALTAEIARILRPGGWFYVSSVVRGPYAWWFRRGALGWQVDPTHVREYVSEQEFAASLNHTELELERVESRPLRFPLADPVLRLAASAGVIDSQLLASAYERHLLLARIRLALQLRVPGYRWVEAIGHRRP